MITYIIQTKDGKNIIFNDLSIEAFMILKSLHMFFLKSQTCIGPVEQFLYESNLHLN